MRSLILFFGENYIWRSTITSATSGRFGISFESTVSRFCIRTLLTKFTLDLVFSFSSSFLSKSSLSLSWNIMTSLLSTTSLSGKRCLLMPCLKAGVLRWSVSINTRSCNCQHYIYSVHHPFYYWPHLIKIKTAAEVVSWAADTPTTNNTLIWILYYHR